MRTAEVPSRYKLHFPPEEGKKPFVVPPPSNYPTDRLPILAATRPLNIELFTHRDPAVEEALKAIDAVSFPKWGASYSTESVTISLASPPTASSNMPLTAWRDDFSDWENSLGIPVAVKNGSTTIEDVDPFKAWEELLRQDSYTQGSQVDQDVDSNHKPPKSIVQELRQDDTAEIDMAAELATLEPPRFMGSEVDETDSKVEHVYVRTVDSNSFPAQDKAAFVDLLFGLPDFSEDERAEAAKRESVEDKSLAELDVPMNWLKETITEGAENETPTSLRKKLVTSLNTTLNKLRANMEPEFMPGAEVTQIIEPDLFDNLDLSDPLALKFLAEKAVLLAKNFMAKAYDKFQPIMAANAEKALAMYEPVPMTEAELRSYKTNKARLAALVVAIALVGQGSPFDNKEKAQKTKLLNTPTESIYNADGTISLPKLADRVKEALALAPPDIFSNEIAAQVIAAPKAKAEKSFIQQRGVLEYPANLVERDGGKLVQLPENESLYRFFTLQDYGEFGVGKGETCAAQRWAQKDTIGVIHTSAQAWNARHPDIRLMIADLNADGHASHMRGIDFDLYLEDDSIRWNSQGYKKENAIELGKIMLETGRVKIMFFNDPDVIVALNNYAREQGLSGEVEYAKNHDAHFHVRTNNEPGPISAPSCEAKAEPAINIPWMNEGVMKLAPFIIESSKEFGVDPELIAILAYIENKGEIGRDSDAGAQGPLQVMPRTGAELAAKLGLKNYNLRDPKTNIRLGTLYVSELLKEYGEASQGPSWNMSTLLAAIGYNGGPGAANGYIKGEVIKTGPFCESRRYGYYATGMWSERHNAASTFFDDYNRAINHCKDNPNSFPIPELQKMVKG